MHNFYVMEGKKVIDYKPKKEHYARAINRIIEELDSFDGLDYPEVFQRYPDKAKQFLYFNIKFIAQNFDFNREYSANEIECWFLLIEGIGNMIGCLTPREFMQIFPVEKDYDGEKHQCKDYFYTMEYINQLDKDVPIGSDNVSEFLFEYQNRDINHYMCTWMGIINRMHKAHGGKDITEEFFEENGYPLHTCHEEAGYLIDDNTGEKFEIRRPTKRARKLFSVVPD